MYTVILSSRTIFLNNVSHHSPAILFYTPPPPPKIFLVIIILEHPINVFALDHCRAKRERKTERKRDRDRNEMCVVTGNLFLYFSCSTSLVIKISFPFLKPPQWSSGTQRGNPMHKAVLQWHLNLTSTTGIPSSNHRSLGERHWRPTLSRTTVRYLARTNDSRIIIKRDGDAVLSLDSHTHALIHTS